MYSLSSPKVGETGAIIIQFKESSVLCSLIETPSSFGTKL